MQTYIEQPRNERSANLLRAVNEEMPVKRARLNKADRRY
jgi:hypothetical protein